MGINIKISNRHIIFQSFSSIGPMLDFVALLPVMGIFAGIYLPEATIVAFLISIVTLIPVIGFSSRIFSNQGYVSYVSESLGKYMGRVSGIIYISYSFLVLPNIIMFLASFLFFFFSLSMSYRILFDTLFAALYMTFIFIPLSKGLSMTIKPIMVLGALEIGTIAVSCIIMFLNPGPSFPAVHQSFSIYGSSFWEAVMLGILMFSGGGSGIFLSGELRKENTSTPRALIYAYLVSGLALIIASFSILIFTGNLLPTYFNDPAILFTRLGNISGNVLLIAIIVLLIASGYNLTLSYGNALLQMLTAFIPGETGMNPGRGILAASLIFFAIPILVVSRIFFSFLYSFLFIAELVSMLYGLNHILVGISSARNGGKMLFRISGIVSSCLLATAIGISVYTSDLSEAYLVAIFLFLAIGSIIMSTNMAQEKIIKYYEKFSQIRKN
jgi:amino acid transporter